MPRRQDHTAQELTEMAIQAVAAHLQSAPASQLSLRKVARDIGYSPGTLINLFGSYDLLLLAFNARTLDAIQHQLLSAIQQSAKNSSNSVIDQLAAAAGCYCDYARSHQHAWRLLFEHRLADDQPLPDWQAQRIATLFTLIEDSLRRLNPEASSTACQTAARVIWSGVHGIATLMLDNKLFMASADHNPDSAATHSEQLIRSLLQHYLTDWCQHHQTDGGEPL
ncbi:MAG: TetR family transcriptional regulator [Oceanospirillaceae bacterium]|uniref:TetR/AcrR family transcriptional regulator n=1 Tax=unclassified Thalassolituus TaxID=2624967 RepID=UPI000C55687E|nr:MULTISPECIES: TetR/AcrR family transcriptional regulator [unclassified Thalassolituus]MAS24921.1 TetR family transcriptional regulator [Oceanospirillaceae bacterium]MAY00353.1 TetR family transcriptional regulator [Oceanospirillaceae bacterium]MBL34549.1 TetR family transcriptional regulator [Oceanospirillaceae bacterium]MBS54717.1 TetR family transcriptional regulator [Oceanospirillaceae bacterium]